MGKKSKALARAREVAEIIAHEAEPDSETFLTRWVMVSEWLMPDGTRFLRCHAPEHMTPWDANALLAAGLEMDLDA